MEEKRKETLTRGHIERDLVKSLHSDILGGTVSALLFLIIANLFGQFLKSVDLSPNWAWVPFWILVAGLALILVKTIRDIVRVRCHRYVLKRDSVVEKIERRSKGRYGYQPYTLIFNTQPTPNSAFPAVTIMPGLRGMT